MEIVREMVTGQKAKVHLILHLTNGVVVKETEPLVRRGGRFAWRDTARSD